MNIQKQMEEMVAHWTDLQRKMWDGWLEALKGMGGSAAAPGAEEWQKAYQQQMDAWEKAVGDALEAQQEWTRKFTQEAGGGQAAPEAMMEMMRQSQEMMKAWTENQTQFWNTWLDNVKKIDPAKLAGQWEPDGQHVLKAWQEATQRAQDALHEISKAAAESAGAAAGSARAAGTAKQAGSAKAAGGAKGGKKK